MTKAPTNSLPKVKNTTYTRVLAGITFFVIIAGIFCNTSPLYVFAQVDNQTNNSGPPSIPVNATNSENETAVGEKISIFVHNAMQLFKQQRDETIQAIKQCHANLANSTGTAREQILNTCKTNLQTIHDKYSDVKTKYNELFKQYKEHMRVFVKEAKGQTVNATEKKQALDHIMSIRKQNEGTHDILQGIGKILKGHKLIGSDHPMMGHVAIQKGKHLVKQGVHDIKKPI